MIRERKQENRGKQIKCLVQKEEGRGKNEQGKYRRKNILSKLYPKCKN